jgi:hypothetical protein
MDGPYRVEYKSVNWPRSSKNITAGETAALSCTSAMKFGSPLIGDRSDCFLLSLRLHAYTGTEAEPVTGRTGYFAMWKALWAVRPTKLCPHVPTMGEQVELEPGCSVPSYYGGSSAPGDDNQLLMFLTAGNKAARWKELLVISEHKYHGRDGVLLRTDDCCMRCAIDQGLRLGGRFFLIL